MSPKTSTLTRKKKKKKAQKAHSDNKLIEFRSGIRDTTKILISSSLYAWGNGTILLTKITG